MDSKAIIITILFLEAGKDRFEKGKNKKGVEWYLEVSRIKPGGPNMKKTKKSIMIIRPWMVIGGIINWPGTEVTKKQKYKSGT